MGQVECCGQRSEDGADYLPDGSPSISLSSIDDFKQKLQEEGKTEDVGESSSSESESDDRFTVKHAIRLRKDGDSGAKLDMELLYGGRDSLRNDKELIESNGMLSNSPLSIKEATLYRKAKLLSSAIDAQTVEEEKMSRHPSETMGIADTPFKNLKSSPSASTVKKKKNSGGGLVKKKKSRKKNVVKNQLVVL